MIQPSRTQTAAGRPAGGDAGTVNRYDAVGWPVQ